MRGLVGAVGWQSGRFRRRPALLATTLLAGLAAVVAPAAAGAAVYCFPNLAVHPSCQEAPGSFQQTMSAADPVQGGTAGPDTVRIGAGVHLISNQGYNNSTDELDIIGAGVGATTLQLGTSNGGVGNTALIFSGSAGSTLTDLTIDLGSNDSAVADNGLALSGDAVARGIAVVGPGAANVSGVQIQGAAALEDSTVDLEVQNSPGNIALRSVGGQTAVTDSTLVADQAATAQASGSSLAIDRSTLRGRSGASLDGGTISLANSVIDLGTADNSVGIQAANLNDGFNSMTVTASNVTIVGGGSSSVGVKAIGDSDGNPTPPDDPNDTVDHGETATVTLSSSVISGPSDAIFVGADRGERASVTTDYSNYTAAGLFDPDLSDDGAPGVATLTETNQTTHPDPGFVNAGSGDYHLLASSPLIDGGDPAAPAPGQLDLDGQPRGLPGQPACPGATGRRDVGADEFLRGTVLDCAAPETTIAGKKKVATKNKRAKITFTLGSSEAGSSFECSLDGAAFASCGATFTRKLKRGKHTLSARARDAAGNLDASAASRTVSITKKKKKQKK